MSFLRHDVSALRCEIEGSLARRVPAALTPSPKGEPELVSCGVRTFDELLRGGLPVGAITEFVGAECSGRTSVAQAYAAAIIQNGSVSAWIDVDDVFDPESATLGGLDCERLLWVRCGRSLPERSEQFATAPTHVQEASVLQAKQTVPHGGGSPHPRSEGRGMPQAIETLLSAQPRSGALPVRRRDKSIGTPGVANRPLPKPAHDREEQIATDRLPPRRGEQVQRVLSSAWHSNSVSVKRAHPKTLTHNRSFRTQRRAWEPLDQALRATDLLLQSGGFSLIVLDLGSTPVEMSWRIPLASWFRFRAACDRTRTSLLLLTKHACAKSSAELVVRMETGFLEAQGGVVAGIGYRSEVERHRFQRGASNVVPIRKPPQSERPGAWKAKATWAL